MDFLNRVNKALIFASAAHDGQWNEKSNENYIMHPIRLMMHQDIHTENLQIVSLLHDCVEDAGASLDNIEEKFGKEIRDAVDAISRKGKESYMDFIRRCKQNELARIVKCADLCDNMDLSRLVEITEKDLKRNKKYQKALEVLRGDRE